MLFISPFKTLIVLKFLKFCHDFFVHAEIGLDKKVKVTFKVHYVINWETNNCNTHIAQYLKN